jgi:flagellar assembly protein FliH
MHKTLNKAEAIAILKASKSTPKTLWSGADHETVIPLFSGGDVVTPSIFGTDSRETQATPTAQSKISPALLSGDQNEKSIRDKVNAEEKEATLRTQITEELEEQYTTRIEELELSLETVTLTARGEGHEEGRKEGFEQGHIQGATQGRCEGEAQTLEELNTQLLAHTDLVKALQRERDDILGSARTDAIELAMRLTERLVGSRLLKEDYLRSRLEQALEAVSDGVGDPIYVKVAPSQVEVFKSITKRSALHESDIYIEPDDSIEIGDIVVEACGRRVSSVLKEQLERLEEVLYE